MDATQRCLLYSTRSTERHLWSPMAICVLQRFGSHWEHYRCHCKLYGHPHSSLLFSWRSFRGPDVNELHHRRTGAHSPSFRCLGRQFPVYAANGCAGAVDCALIHRQDDCWLERHLLYGHCDPRGVDALLGHLLPSAQVREPSPQPHQDGRGTRTGLWWHFSLFKRLCALFVGSLLGRAAVPMDICLCPIYSDYWVRHTGWVHCLRYVTTLVIHRSRVN